MGTGSVLGVPSVRPAFLDDLSTTGSRQGETDGGRIVTDRCAWRVDDENDDDLDDDDDDFQDTDEDEDTDDEDDEDDDEDDVETWQVRRP